LFSSHAKPIAAAAAFYCPYATPESNDLVMASLLYVFSSIVIVVSRQSVNAGPMAIISTSSLSVFNVQYDI